MVKTRCPGNTGQNIHQIAADIHVLQRVIMNVFCYLSDLRNHFQVRISPRLTLSKLKAGFMVWRLNPNDSGETNTFYYFF